MSINKVCDQFDTFWKFFRDGLKDSKHYDFNIGTFKKYCPNSNCDADADIINAGCLWLFNAFFDRYGISNYGNSYKDVAVCIMIWLGYILNLKPHKEITSLMDFYSKHIENNTKYTDHKFNDSDYDSYKIIDEIKEYMNIDINNMSKFYELLKLLCNMDNAYNKNKSNNFSEDAKKFVDKYQEFLDDDNNTDGSPYSKVLLVLSKCYEEFGKYTVLNSTPKDRPSLPTKKTAKDGSILDSKGIKTIEPSSEAEQSIHITTTPSFNTTLSGSTLASKLIPVLLIFAAIPIFLGIAYKYSLFGFRKQSQKQQLREKLKK
ncbi:PIR protein [Plasmodium yoelii yoelii]|uniref:PIR protein n=1 Tax=Plasmodium yoelii yoelii TaxID=73239 RepID=A0AAF0B7K9_PLAYO|nr:PIR protein [Plasmodium yoelii yoelii]